MAEHRTPNPGDVGSNPSWPANRIMNKKKAKKPTQTEPKTGLTGKLKEFQSFFQQSKMEMKKVTYPSQKQTLTTCASVLVVVFVISLFLGVVDLALSKILEVVLP